MRRLSIVALLLLVSMVANAQPYHSGGDVKAPVAIHRVEPLYPDEARQAGISGIVILETLVDRNGVVKDVRVLKPLPFGLSEAAVDAVRQWRFKPGTKNGEPVDVISNLTINFMLHSDDAPLRVGGDVRAPVVVQKVEASYTEEARNARINGIVILEVVIGRDGLVKKASILKPLPFGLDQAAIDAVTQWKFKPGTLNDKPVDVIFNIVVNFKLDQKTPDSESN
ncbi:MAG: bla regulator protein blaR1 [Thermoanaerobaculia bacterium]|nr:bla regulator protein blaR1 [Thermoanaerobaculia bacterium]